VLQTSSTVIDVAELMSVPEVNQSKEQQPIKHKKGLYLLDVYYQELSQEIALQRESNSFCNLERLDSTEVFPENRASARSWIKDSLDRRNQSDNS